MTRVYLLKMTFDYERIYQFFIQEFVRTFQSARSSANLNYYGYTQTKKWQLAYMQLRYIYWFSSAKWKAITNHYSLKSFT